MATDPMVARILGKKYRILKKIGQGGMGAVYLARHVDLDRLSAVKILPELYGHDEMLVARFQQEARATAALNHPNVVMVFDVGSDADFHWLAMEYIEGESLAERLERAGPLAFEEALSVVVSAAEGLAAAHARQVIHRDVKPANLMHGNDGRVKVMDFGLARLVEETSGLSTTGQVLGTPHYMSPEQATSDELDGRTDVYGLGASWYALVTGKPPFDAMRPAWLIMQKMQQDPPDPTALVPELPGPMRDVMLRMLARRPEDRYPSMADCLEDLRRLRQGLPVSPPPRPAGAALPLGTIGTGAALLLAAVALLAVWRPWRRPAPQPKPPGMTKLPSKPPAQPAAPRTAPDEVAFAQLSKILLAVETPLPDKMQACRTFLELHPRSAHAPRVGQHLRELLDKHEEWIKQERQRWLDQTYDKLAKTVELLLAKHEYERAWRAAEAAPDGLSARVTLLHQKIKRQRAAHVAKLRVELERARQANDRLVGKECLAQLRQLGASDLAPFERWLAVRPTPPDPKPEPKPKPKRSPAERLRLLDRLGRLVREAAHREKLAGARAQLVQLRAEQPPDARPDIDRCLAHVDAMRRLFAGLPELLVAARLPGRRASALFGTSQFDGFTIRGYRPDSRKLVLAKRGLSVGYPIDKLTPVELWRLGGLLEWKAPADPLATLTLLLYAGKTRQARQLVKQAAVAPARLDPLLLGLLPVTWPRIDLRRWWRRLPERAPPRGQPEPPVKVIGPISGDLRPREGALVGQGFGLYKYGPLRGAVFEARWRLPVLLRPRPGASVGLLMRYGAGDDESESRKTLDVTVSLRLDQPLLLIEKRNPRNGSLVRVMSTEKLPAAVPRTGGEVRLRLSHRGDRLLLQLSAGARLVFEKSYEFAEQSRVRYGLFSLGHDVTLERVSVQASGG